MRRVGKIRWLRQKLRYKLISLLRVHAYILALVGYILKRGG